MIISIIESTFNHLLESDPQGKARLTGLAGKTIGLELKNTPLNVLATIHLQGMALQTGSLLQADCVLRGTPIALMRYLNAKQVSPATNLNLGVEIEGDLEFAQSVSRIFRHLDIDWEEVFSVGIGDLPAHGLSMAMSRFHRGLGRSKRSAGEHLKYILTERTDELVFEDEAQSFYHDVDQLAAQAEQLEQKINHMLDGQTNA